MHMQTVKAHRYGRERKVGDRYECAEKDVRLVKALGWAVPVPPEPEIEHKPTRAKPEAAQPYLDQLMGMFGDA